MTAMQFEPPSIDARSARMAPYHRLLMATFFSVVFLSELQPSCAQHQNAERASVEQLSAMLQTIDPYRPNLVTAGNVLVFGSTSMDALAHGWTKGFHYFHKQAEVIVSAAGSGTTFERLAANPSGIGMLSRPVKDEELEKLRQLGLKQPTAFVVAREALGVFVHQSNPIQSISGDQLKRVFTCDRSERPPNWAILGAAGSLAKQSVHVISRTENSGTQRFLADFVFGSCKLREGISDHVSNAEVLQQVSQDPSAIAICGLRSTGSSVKVLQLTTGSKVIPSDDHAVLTGQYPLTRPLTLVLDMGRTDKDAQASQEFVRYALCRAGQTQAILVGFFPIDLPLLRAGLQKLNTSQLR
jgi:phosphate transport system substrate-binding protein